MHAVPGAGSAKLSAGGKAVGGAVGFGGATSYASLPDGRTALRLTPAGGGRPLARATETLDGGRYTAIASKLDGKNVLRVYRDGRARGATARMRAINAAGELGRVNVTADGRTIARAVGLGDQSAYATLDPGRYTIAVRGAGTGPALASRPGTNLVAGTTSTAVLIGSGGEPTRVLVLQDGASAPTAAPATGLGGLDGGEPWLAALGAALAAGALGGGAHALVARRRREA